MRFPPGSLPPGRSVGDERGKVWNSDSSPVVSGAVSVWFPVWYDLGGFISGFQNCSRNLLVAGTP